MPSRRFYDRKHYLTPSEHAEGNSLDSPPFRILQATFHIFGKPDLCRKLVDCMEGCPQPILTALLVLMSCLKLACNAALYLQLTPVHWSILEHHT